MGRVTYNGHGMNEFVPQRTAAYISQHDTHIGEMTVRETLAFSARCQGVGDRYDMLAELSRREKAANIKPDPDLDVFMKAAATEDFGTRHLCRYHVGDEMIRGISGGQRKRVTTGEMLVGPSKALFMDEISTGLDSSTTFQIINSLKQTIHILNGTAVISLLQPAPETYNLFDDIILLSDSQIVYQGPREDVLEFFESIGFKCPERKGEADFLQEVTSRKDQAQYWARKDVPYSFVTVKEFAEAFQSFHIGRKVADELASPFDRAKSHPAALTTKKYGVRKKELLDANMSREYLLMKRNSFVYIFKLTQVKDGSIYTGALFFTVVMIMFNGMARTCHDNCKTSCLLQAKRLSLLSCMGICSPTWVLKIPITFVEVAVWVFITYYVIGFDPNVERLFRQYLLLLLVNQMASGLFRFIAAAGRNMIVASTFGAFAVLMLMALVVLSCHMIMSRNGGLGLLVVPSDVCTECNSECYQFNRIPWNHSIEVSWVLHRRTLVLDRSWALLGFIFVFNFFYTLCLNYLNPFEKPQAVITEESDNAKTATTERGEHMVEAIAEGNHNKKKGMVLPFQPHSITFDDIRYSVDMPEEMKSQGALEDRLELLKGVSGAFRPGVLTALMGVSGAGKTTLMDVLAGRKTVLALLSLAAVPSDVNSETRKMFIEEVMELVELTPLRDALVGLPGVNGLSTEQRKRLTIAVELVANPSIIFMDEPTSGLDARAAAIVMRTVRNTVDTGRTVVCTIHQPSIDIFEAFDELLLMKRGGQEIYVGPLGRHSSHLINYFEGIEGVSKIKDGYNPATWMLEVTTGSTRRNFGGRFH
ncbi:Pleiotropic drug resistance protein 1 [Vitis vinifera]|uniref:Pleiotropic drug resistance protein 1 n=1 Tax=Vitis vinifera TaxID=29760 RepID=A0A438GZC1_VITVI|nr:Pleiotropic drug resistance protein 1 [Vitis vinifera]